MVYNRNEQYNAYNLATRTVSKTRQIVMLYDGAIRFSQQARKAIEEKRIEDRFNLLMKVAEILMGLQGSLDHENGGEIAKLLHNYYSSLDARVLYVQRHNDLRILDSVIAELKQMRGAWGGIDALAATPVVSSATMAEEAEKDSIPVPAAELTPVINPTPLDASFFVSV